MKQIQLCDLLVMAQHNNKGTVMEIIDRFET